MVPVELLDELYEEDRTKLLLEGSSLYELYDRVTDSGTAIKMYRKVKREEDDDLRNYTKFLTRVPAVEDVGGGIMRSQLERIDPKRLKDLVDDINFQLEYYKAENFILNNTVQSLEKREMEIEKALPVFKFTIGATREGEKVTEKVTDDVCEENLSSNEENLNGANESFAPSKDIDEQDDYFANMNGKSKEALHEFFQRVGEIVPSNYDPFLHRYSDLVMPEEEESLEDKASRVRSQEATHHSIGGGAPQVQENIVEDDDLKTRENSVAELLHNKLVADPHNLGGLQEEDADFPDFVMRFSKTLPIEERLKYGRKEEDILRLNYAKIENREIVKANKIIVYTDTYMKSFKLLKTIFEILCRTFKNGYHVVTGRMKAEDILRFRRRMKRIILAEEVKHRMTVNEYRRRKNKVDRQVRENRELGESIQVIDFDHLRISNLQYQHKIEEQLDILNQLKLITASQLDQLKILKQKVHKKVIIHAHLVNDIQLRNSLKKNFEKKLVKSNEAYKTIRQRNRFLQARLDRFQAPSTLDYMNLKRLASDLEEEVRELRGKLVDITSALTRAREQRQSVDLTFPPALIRSQNAEWLRGVKREVRVSKLAQKTPGDLLPPTGGPIEKFLEAPPSQKREIESEGKARFSVRPKHSIVEEPSRKLTAGGRGGSDTPPKKMIVPIETGDDYGGAAAAVHRLSAAVLRNRLLTVKGGGEPRPTAVGGVDKKHGSLPAVQEVDKTLSRPSNTPLRHHSEPRASVGRKSVTVEHQLGSPGAEDIDDGGELPAGYTRQRRKTFAEAKAGLVSELGNIDQTIVQNY